MVSCCTLCVCMPPCMTAIMSHLQMEAMEAKSYRPLWRDYIRALKQLLREAQDDPQAPAAKRLVRISPDRHHCKLECFLAPPCQWALLCSIARKSPAIHDLHNPCCSCISWNGAVRIVL